MKNKQRLLLLAQDLRKMASTIELSINAPQKNQFYFGIDKYDLDELCGALIDLRTDIKWNGIEVLKKMIEENND